MKLIVQPTTCPAAPTPTCLPAHISTPSTQRPPRHCIELPAEVTSQGHRQQNAALTGGQRAWMPKSI